MTLALVQDHQAERAPDPGQDPQQGLDQCRPPARRRCSAVSSSVSVDADSRARPPRSWSSSSRVLTRLPLWPSEIARRGPSRSVGWEFSQIVEPVVE